MICSPRGFASNFLVYFNDVVRMKIPRLTRRSLKSVVCQKLFANFATGFLVWFSNIGSLLHFECSCFEVSGVLDRSHIKTIIVVLLLIRPLGQIYLCCRSTGKLLLSYYFFCLPSFLLAACSMSIFAKL